MKNLKTLLVMNSQTDVAVFEKVVADWDIIELKIETNLESAIELMTNNEYQLLVVDKNLLSDDFNKINKLADMLFPNTVMININLGDEDFIRFKITDLIEDWKDSQSDSKRNFIDNPNGF